MFLVGPFTQILTGSDEPINDAAMILSDGKITAIDTYHNLRGRCDQEMVIEEPSVVLPGFIDAHTHLCYAGSRAEEYAQRVSGQSYQAKGILSTVEATRQASFDELQNLLGQRLDAMLSWGVTTCEVKSGYGLTVHEELKQLAVINETKHPITRIATCLAAHVVPPEFTSETAYLDMILSKLLPLLPTKRLDLFIDEGAFSIASARQFMQKAEGFTFSLHVDQFQRGGGLLAAEMHALSADHLEQSTEEEWHAFQQSGTIPIVLPGASLGLGLPFAPARQILNAGLPLVIASDWNPGSAPMGNLLTQAALIGAAEKLSLGETLAAITSRAAAALQLTDRGILEPGKRADFNIFPTNNWQEIFYAQGRLMPSQVFIGGECVHST